MPFEAFRLSSVNIVYMKSKQNEDPLIQSFDA